jgi:hypothetical protein
MSCWWFYRGKLNSVADLTLPLGLLLVFLAIVFPKALVYPNRAWMTLAGALGFITTPIVLAVVYFLLITPIGFAKRLFGWDPLSRRAAPRESYWRPYSERQRDSRHFEKMY